jgi:hypothetical protein
VDHVSERRQVDGRPKRAYKPLMSKMGSSAKRPTEIRRRLEEIFKTMTQPDALVLWDEAATLVESLSEGSRARREVQWLMEAIKEKGRALR